jgi:hypothetical protein
VAFLKDPECARAYMDICLVLRTPAEVLSRPGLRDTFIELGSGWRDEAPQGPTRKQLLEAVS